MKRRTVVRPTRRSRMPGAETVGQIADAARMLAGETRRMAEQLAAGITVQSLQSHVQVLDTLAWEITRVLARSRGVELTPKPDDPLDQDCWMDIRHALIGGARCDLPQAVCDRLDAMVAAAGLTKSEDPGPMEFICGTCMARWYACGQPEGRAWTVTIKNNPPRGDIAWWVCMNGCNVGRREAVLALATNDRERAYLAPLSKAWAAAQAAKEADAAKTKTAGRGGVGTRRNRPSARTRKHAA